ncbi:mitochondrial carrier [Saitoella complicata NRRL Y-17804]|uniref:mitochondrial carrier n=1 Tax=Saitoella complicata (strain BCRC 22490 / CBS 7301 / JCM 7358 / NBRC 10748 / NRRL Y-17804) TaxID=698492 RepID=UPI000866C72A|nr:mitochondrial carrier [Saitoella complicata NRRL Y-17804]ODQ50750.1 mitochondrial carrier [Saitoella complicata NRRL Y-17804]
MATTLASKPFTLWGGDAHLNTKQTFEKHASLEKNGEKYMTQMDFVNAIAPDDEDYRKIPREQFALLFRIADRSRTGLVNHHDFHYFQSLLSKADADYEIAFRFFEPGPDGKVDYHKFRELYDKYKSSDAIPFNWDCNWASLYIGEKKSRHSMTYHQFGQMLRGLQGERIRQAFHYFDKDGDGYIEPREFQRIIIETAKHKLSDNLLENLHTLCDLSPGAKISYSDVRAFHNVCREMDVIDRIVQNACTKSHDGKISKEDFLNESALTTRFSLFSPMEVDILFHFAGINSDATSAARLGLDDFSRVIDPAWEEPLEAQIRGVAAIHKLKEKTTESGSFLTQILESVHHFALGAVAGGIGATVVYPIDLVKTRMQNQRSAVVGQLMYKNSLDCFRKVIRNEGAIGLYSGLGPQLIGVAPEKAIKLTVNDLVRGKAMDDNGNIALRMEILAGAMAGGCQVVFTNPLEIVKIRLQIQGELAKTSDVPRRSAAWIVRNLGLLGLYKGASACLLRDIPFSAIYFPTYAHLKKDYFGERPGKTLSIPQLLMAGAIAGMPAAYLTTPADVIKTRLQAESRKGQTHYRNIHHAATTIVREEGFKALFKGGPARILRSSPQFGCTLAAYEFLQRLLPMPGSTAHSESALQISAAGEEDRKKSHVPSLPYLRSKNALKMILDLDENFGRRAMTIPQGIRLPGMAGASTPQ